MHLSFHGGKCCAIRHVHGFGEHGPDEPEYSYEFDPSEWLAEELEDITDKPSHEKWPDNWGDDVSSATRAFHLAAPEETKGERLKRYIEYLKEHRPGGILEAVLVDSFEFPQVTQWRPFLEALGFKEVNRIKNSNSYNTCVVFHLNMIEES